MSLKAYTLQALQIWGDVSHLMPVVHPWVGCVKGVLHGASYNFDNKEAGLKKTAKVLAMTIIDLLADDAWKLNVFAIISNRFSPKKRIANTWTLFLPNSRR